MPLPHSDSRGQRAPAAARVGLLAGLLLALALAGCGGSAPICRFDDTVDQMISTRQVFLERLAGCPIGGRN